MHLERPENATKKKKKFHCIGEMNHDIAKEAFLVNEEHTLAPIANLSHEGLQINERNFFKSDVDVMR